MSDSGFLGQHQSINDLVEHLAVECSDWLHSVFRRYTDAHKLHWTIEDFAQELFLNLLQRLQSAPPTIDSPDELKRFIASCAKNLIRDRVRAVNCRQDLGSEPTSVNESFVDCVTLADNAVSVEEQLTTTEKYALIQHLFSEHSTRTENIGNLRFFQGLTHGEIADALDQSKEVVAKRWQLLAKKIRDRLVRDWH
ncbi:MAG: sigma-70 family RNA polymerase sigma factor [Planctomycetota bacterium]